MAFHVNKQLEGVFELFTRLESYEVPEIVEKC